MSRLILLLLVSSILMHQGACQDNSDTVATNVVYLELLGAGGFGSLNYEHLFLMKESLRSGLRAGIITSRIFDFQGRLNPDFSLPVSWLLFYGSKHNLEFGLGTTFTSTVRASSGKFTPERRAGLHQHFCLGYRYQKTGSGFLFRITYTPVIEFYRYFSHWGGTSLGYAF